MKYSILLIAFLLCSSSQLFSQNAELKKLMAATIERYLSFTVGHQKYGTNRVFNEKTGKEELVPIDRAIPDSERAEYGVAPLAELLKQYPEQKAERKSATSTKAHKKTR